LLEEVYAIITSNTATKAQKLYTVEWINAMPLHALESATNIKLRNFLEKRLKKWLGKL